MSTFDDTNIDTNPPLIYTQYDVPQTVNESITNISGDTTIINTINGNSGKASGPTVTISGGSTGYDFVASGNTIALTVGNAATVRTSIGAAASGANGDITSFTALTGNTGWANWTGTPDKTSHATYSGTASAIYTQAELQGVMDSLKNVTEAMMALIATLMGWGGLET